MKDNDEMLVLVRVKGIVWSTDKGVRFQTMGEGCRMDDRQGGTVPDLGYATGEGERIQDSRLLNYLIREIETWLNINHITVHNNIYCLF